jgi:MFS family permease
MLTAMALGLAQGARHCLEPDHLAAVSVLIGDRRSARRSAWLGALWGFGHTLSLVSMSIALVAFGAALPDRADRAFALVVAATLIALGLRSLFPAETTAPNRRVRTPLQAVLVGGLHGFAGSSALTAVVFAALPDALSRLLYVALFGLGSIVGMAAASGAAGAWLQRIERPGLMAGLRIAIGLTSIAIGVMTAIDAVGAG